MASSQTYAEIFKKQFSLATAPSMSTATQQQPSCKRHATLLAYDADPQLDYPPLAPTNAPTTVTAIPVDYRAKMEALKQDLQSLRTLINTAVAQLKQDIASIQVFKVTHTSNDMETDLEPSLAPTPAIPELIAELKHDIATVVIKMRAKFAQLSPTMKHIQQAPT